MDIYTPSQFYTMFFKYARSLSGRCTNKMFYNCWFCLAKPSTLTSQLYPRHVKGDPVRISRVSLGNQSSRFLGYYPTMILTFVTKFDKWQCTAIGLNSNFIQSTSIK